MAGAGTAQLRDPDEVILRVEHLVVEFAAGRKARVHAVSDVSFDVAAGETLGLVGESGCGKSTTARAIVQLPPPSAGSVRLGGRELTRLSGGELRRARREIQMIFQDPISSLNPRRRVVDLVGEPLAIAGITEGRRHRINEVLEAVALPPEAADARPHELSGGQCQRVSIARALIQDPKVIICDEPVSALDVSVQAQILNLLEDMKARYGVTLLFISHDLSVVKNVSDRVAVMYLGKLCELTTADDLYRSPMHPYTRALIGSIPSIDRSGSRATPLAGELPSPLEPPSGCRFRTRCPKAQARCAAEEPVMTELRPAHFVACHFPDDPALV
ncbi:MAG: ABC transporter ATP-binding protein [Acidimicrobiales bacterium]